MSTIGVCVACGISLIPKASEHELTQKLHRIPGSQLCLGHRPARKQEVVAKLHRRNGMNEVARRSRRLIFGVGQNAMRIPKIGVVDFNAQKFKF
jgi:hypothetical protein